jgi:ABC-2 type transport system ATP-binding protein
MPQAIEVERLERSFGSVTALRGISFTADEGEVFAFLGPNGAGKTTVVRILTTLLLPSAGVARVGGRDVVADAGSVRRQIGVALQEVGLDGLQTSRELLEIQGRMYGDDRRGAADRAADLLDRFGLGEEADRRVKTLSGGVKRRLDLALALVHKPRVLFLDEPTTGLDPVSRATVWEEIARLNRTDGVSVFLTTHYLDEADHLSDRLAILNNGEIVAEGRPAELKAGVQADRVRMRFHDESTARAAAERVSTGETRLEANGDMLELMLRNGTERAPALVQELQSSGIPVAALSIEAPSLDDVFMRATGARIATIEAEQRQEAVLR